MVPDPAAGGGDSGTDEGSATLDPAPTGDLEEALGGGSNISLRIVGCRVHFPKKMPMQFLQPGRLVATSATGNAAERDGTSHGAIRGKRGDELGTGQATVFIEDNLGANG